MAKKVSQNDLRQLMQKMKTDKSSNKSEKLKKYKISQAEAVLLQERKAKQRAQELASMQKQQKIQEDLLNKKPAKSILKNSGSSAGAFKRPAAVPLTSMMKSYGHVDSDEDEKSIPVPDISKRVKTDSSAPKSVPKAATKDEEPPSEDQSTPLPEGFFDDPIKDAKARNIEYKDPVEEQWEMFKKEINIELDTAQDIVAEEQMEATADRQLDEIDEQMRAWSRVREMEKKKDEIEEHISQKKSQHGEAPKEDDDSDEEVDIEDELDWRKKS